jgi:hypothetical protein
MMNSSKEGRMKTQKVSLGLVIVLFLGVPQPASAYVGPGSGITVIGAALAFIGAIFSAIVGFVWRLRSGGDHGTRRSSRLPARSLD